MSDIYWALFSAGAIKRREIVHLNHGFALLGKTSRRKQPSTSVYEPEKEIEGQGKI